MVTTPKARRLAQSEAAPHQPMHRLPVALPGQAPLCDHKGTEPRTGVAGAVTCDACLDAQRFGPVVSQRVGRIVEMTGPEEERSASQYWRPTLHPWTPPKACPACGCDGCGCTS